MVTKRNMFLTFEFNIDSFTTGNKQLEKIWSYFMHF